MDINWYGQSCFRLKGKTTSVVIDPFDPTKVGLKLPKEVTAPLILSSHNHEDHNYFAGVGEHTLELTGPGEYEFSGVTVNGTRTYHDKVQGAERGQNTVYHILMDGINIVHVGDLGHALTEEQLSDIGDCDILMVPVGSVFTINAAEAAAVVAQLEPRIVIPMHYKIEGLVYPLDPVDLFMKAMAAETVQPVPKLTITKDKLPDDTQVVVLSKS
jgi:L-ascorbate metabolism protein UlaG (beta-lactamase superfamily)